MLLVTALCGVGGTLTPTAEAAVVSTPGISPGSPLLVPNNFDGVYINVVTGATAPSSDAVGWDFNAYSSATNTALSFFSPPAPAGGAMMRFPGSATVSAGNLPFGSPVDASGTFSSATNSIPFGPNPGDWVLNDSNYFGFRFLNEATSQVHFGWGRMEVGAAPTIRSIAELYFEDQPGIAIAVGTVPEPTGSLLAAGAAGIIALRRRRQVA